MTNTPIFRPRTIVATLATFSLLAAACGSDDDGDPDTNWFVSPSKVRASEIWKNDYPGLVVDGDSDSADGIGSCGTKPGEVVVLWPDESPPTTIETEDFLLVLQGPVDSVDGLFTYTTDSGGEGQEAPVRASQQLGAAGIIASPNYEVFLAPGRMFFPGNLPDEVPEDEQPDLDFLAEADDSSVVVDIIDSGGRGYARTVGETDNRTKQSVAYGHGAFVAGVIAQDSAATMKMWSLGQGRFYESDLLQAANRVMAEDTDPHLTNLSAGVVVCNHGLVAADSDEFEYAATSPLLTLLGTATALTARDSVLVAAAGNSGGSQVRTYPAAFASDQPGADANTRTPRAICPGEAALSISLDGSLAEDTYGEDVWREFCDTTEARANAALSSVATGIVAVGADDDADGESYSTEGDWIGSFRNGCRTSAFPAADIEYIAVVKDQVRFPNVTVKFQELGKSSGQAYSIARWCGSSFATAAVTAEIAENTSGSDFRAEAASHQQL